MLFDTVTGEPPAGVVPLDVADPAPATRPPWRRWRPSRALPAEIRGEVAAVTAASAEDISLTLTDGTLVRWGGPEQSDRKGAALAGDRRAARRR